VGDYGFIKTSDDREVYFHRNSAFNGDLSRLKFGTEVTFIEEQGKEGPQAARVAISRRWVSPFAERAAPHCSA
jgi:cold shock CspA family protein